MNVFINSSLLPLGILIKKALYRRTPKYLFPPVCSVACLLYLYSQATWPCLIGIATLRLGWQFSVIGITGGIGSGKSTAAQYARDSLNYVLIDADVIARKVVCSETSGFKAIVEAFGPSIVDPTTRELDRAKLGKIVFDDPSKRRLLERITHPRIFVSMLKSVVFNRLMGNRVLLDVPLLFEGSLLYYMCSECVLIDTSEEEQTKRVRARNPQLTDQDIQKRIRSQLSREGRRKFADHVVDNSTTIENLHAQLDRILK